MYYKDKNTRVCVRFSEYQFERLLNLCDIYNLSPSVLIRKLVDVFSSNDLRKELEKVNENFKADKHSHI